jgi:hypothetical protein
MRRSAIAIFSLCVTACSTAKLEARLEANPQCKDIVNPKTGTLMPCPGSDKAFYQSVGLVEPTRPAQGVAATAVIAPSSSASTSEGGNTPPPKQPNQINQTNQLSLPTDCKPSLHKKTGGILPCPSPN